MSQLSVPASRLRDDRDFARYWCARVASSTGDVVTFVAMPVLVYRISGSPLLTAITSGLEALPYLLFGLLSGVVSDRWDRRRVMIGADLVSAILMATIPIAYQTGVLTIPHVLVIAFAVPATQVFFDGANFGALPVLVGRARIAEANASVWGAATAVEIGLPSVVGLGLAVINPADFLAIDALSFVASALLVRTIRRPMHEGNRAGHRLTIPSVLADIREGLSYVMRHDGVRTMTIVSGLQCVAGGGFMALWVVWCDRVLGIGTEGWRFGLVFTGWSVGALAAMILLPRVLRRASAARITLLALPPSAVLGILTGLTTNWVLGCLGLLAWGATYSLVTINAISYRQQVTPERLLGRVNTAGRMLAWGIGWPVGALLGGVLGATAGTRPAMVSTAAVALVAVAIAWTSPLRHLAVHDDEVRG